MLFQSHTFASKQPPSCWKDEPNLRYLNSLQSFWCGRRFFLLLHIPARALDTIHLLLYSEKSPPLSQADLPDGMQSILLRSRNETMSLNKNGHSDGVIHEYWRQSQAVRSSCNTKFLCWWLVFNQPNHKFPLVETWSGIIISHLSHLFSVWALYDTSRRLFQYLPGSTNLPYLASVLHTISPAGLFLSGPYAESLFSCFSFLAYNLYVRSALCEEDSLRKELYQLISALLLSISTTIRTNGLLNGLLFVSEAFYGCSNLLHRRPNFKLFRRLIMICICGYVVGCGYLIPQYIAYQEYCSSSTTDPRPWCKAKLPSIYNFVQSYYW